MVALITGNHRREKKHDQVALKLFPNSSQDRPQIVPRRSQNRSKKGLGRLLELSRASPEGPRSAQEHQDAPKTSPRAPQERTRTAQERPKSAQESPKSGQEAPKRGPRLPQGRPKRVQEGSEVRPKRHSSETSKKPRFFELSPLAGRDTGGLNRKK